MEVCMILALILALVAALFLKVLISLFMPPNLQKEGSFERDFRRMVAIHSLIYLVLISTALFYVTSEGLAASYHGGSYILFFSILTFVLIFITFYGYSTLPKVMRFRRRLVLYFSLSILTGVLPFLYLMVYVVMYTKIALFGGFLVMKCWGSGNFVEVVDYLILIPIITGWASLFHFVFFNAMIARAMRRILKSPEHLPEL